MPALRKVAPVILKEILEAAGWSIYTESRLNWSLVNEQGISLEIPKKGRLVAFQLLENALSQAELAPGDYFRLLETVQSNRRLIGLPEDGSETHPRIH